MKNVEEMTKTGNLRDPCQSARASVEDDLGRTCCVVGAARGIVPSAVRSARRASTGAGVYTACVNENLPVEVQELIDRQAIFDCLKRLARGMDRHDVDLMRASYHPDGFDDHGTFRGNAYDAIDYLNGTESTVGAHDNFLCTQHHLTNHVVDLDGDVAHSETYYLFVGRLRDGGTLQTAGGRYIDRLERRDGRWAITVRRVLMDWHARGGQPPEMTAPPEVFLSSTWDRTDLSYERPLSVPQVVGSATSGAAGADKSPRR